MPLSIETKKIASDQYKKPKTQIVPTSLQSHRLIRTDAVNESISENDPPCPFPH